MLAAVQAKRAATVRLRTDAFNPQAGTFSAYVSVYDVEYEVGWGFKERISPGAFDESIRARPILPVFYEHDWKAGPVGSATASSDGRGIKADGRLYTELGSDLVGRVHQGMQDGALNEWSVAFYLEDDGVEWTRENPALDIITRGDLAEATICVRGANPETETLALDSGRTSIRIVGDREPELARIRSAHVAQGRAAGDPGDNPEASQLAGQIETLLGQFTDVADAQDAQDLLSILHSAEEDLMAKVAPPSGSSSAGAAETRTLFDWLASPNPALRAYAREALSSKPAGSSS